MALATTCPQCKTSFKVVPDQLKLRRGLVRCGVCQHVFSGIDYLRYVDEATRAGVQRTPAGGSAAPTPTPAGPSAAAPSHAPHAPHAPAAPAPATPAPQPPTAGPAFGAPVAGRDGYAGRDAGAASPREDRFPLETQPMPSAAHAFESLPTVPHPPAGGPQTVISADDDLKTAFFLTDSGFGPFPGEHPDAVLPTSIQRAAPTPQPAGAPGQGEPAPGRAAGDGRTPGFDYAAPFDFAPTSGHATPSVGAAPAEQAPAADLAASGDRATRADRAEAAGRPVPTERPTMPRVPTMRRVTPTARPTIVRPWPRGGPTRSARCAVPSRTSTMRWTSSGRPGARGAALGWRCRPRRGARRDC